MTEEYSSQRFRTAEARQARGLSDVPAGFQCRTCEFDPDQFDVACRSHSQFGLKQSGQLAGAQRCPRREVLHAVVSTWVGGDRIGDHSQRGLRRRVGLEQHRELRLASCAFEIYHQRSGDLADQFGPVVQFDQRQSEVDARRHTRRSEQIAIADKDRVRFDTDIGVGASQESGVSPMRGCPTATE